MLVIISNLHGFPRLDWHLIIKRLRRWCVGKDYLPRHSHGRRQVCQGALAPPPRGALEHLKW